MKSPLAAALLALLAMPLLADADLSITNESTLTVVRAGANAPIDYTIHNAGPDTASKILITITMTGVTESTPCTSGCTTVSVPISSDLPAGKSVRYYSTLPAPATAGEVTLTVTVSSGVPDPNPADNSYTTTFTVSPDPDVLIGVGAAPRLDLGLPFRLTIGLGNYAPIDAHDVDGTVDFSTDASVLSLPVGCTNPIPGRVICHVDALAGGIAGVRTFPVTLVAPPTYGSGSISFAATATEREPDFDPQSNVASSTSQLYNTFYVTSTANDGTGSLRQAILDANAATSGPIAIAFRIGEASSAPWKTIRITSPLPPIEGYDVRVDGATQSGFFGDTNPDGPEIEITGSGSVDGDGLELTNCEGEFANLAINGFRGNGLSVTDSHRSPDCSQYFQSTLHNLFIGTDPTGTEARPNGQRGIAVSVAGVAIVHDCVLSGNDRSGIFDLSGVMTIWGNRIGVKAHSDDPLPNGASGIFIGPDGYGSAIGADILTPTRPGNVIAFNREMGVAIASGVNSVSVRGNRIWSNGGLGIDIGLDGPTLSTKSRFGSPIDVPTLTLAHYDPVSAKTTIEGDTLSSLTIDLYASDIAGPFGFGDGQRPIASKSADLVEVGSANHFRIVVDGDLTGQFITATATFTDYEGFAKPEGTDQGFLTQTSEFSRAIEVR
ncbi:MAG TPA: right-handed parallel beta-helix repeat-containing protein [Thermoanaerobaculia bacterium]|jgi:hypothetical protein|nr:right-handed parallel beta-helix repeat-containing protein [Thermoanaerobaculia bacterium]